MQYVIKKSVPLNKIENKEQGDGGTNEPTSFWFWVLRSALKKGGKDCAISIVRERGLIFLPG